MARQSALFVVWAAIGFALSLELLYLLTPFGIAGLAVVTAVCGSSRAVVSVGSPPSGGSSPARPRSASSSPRASTSPPSGL